MFKTIEYLLILCVPPIQLGFFLRKRPEQMVDSNEEKSVEQNTRKKTNSLIDFEDKGYDFHSSSTLYSYITFQWSEWKFWLKIEKFWEFSGNFPNFAHLLPTFSPLSLGGGTYFGSIARGVVSSQNFRSRQGVIQAVSPFGHHWLFGLWIGRDFEWKRSGRVIEPIVSIDL